MLDAATLRPDASDASPRGGTQTSLPGRTGVAAAAVGVADADAPRDAAEMPPPAARASAGAATCPPGLAVSAPDSASPAPMAADDPPGAGAPSADADGADSEEPAAAAKPPAAPGWAICPVSTENFIVTRCPELAPPASETESTIDCMPPDDGATNSIRPASTSAWVNRSPAASVTPSRTMRPAAGGCSRV
jgi:hypothetical protein